MNTRTMHWTPILVALATFTSASGCSGAGDDAPDLDAETDTDAEAGTRGEDGSDGPEPDTGDSGGSEDDGDGESGAEGDSGGELPDTTAPEIVSVIPEDGAVGVLPDAPIVIHFSEPMDAASVEDAFLSADLPAVSFSWNAEGDELTITPDVLLEWSWVQNADEEPTSSYGFSLGDAATDLAGNPLDAVLEARFAIMRAMIAQLTPNGALSGWVRSSEHAQSLTSSGEIVVGDSGASGVPNAYYLGMLTFDLSDLPENTEIIAEARLDAEQILEIGDPYGELDGQLLADHVSYSDLTLSEAEAPPLSQLGVVSEALEPALIEIDVTDAIKADFAEDPTGHAQFRFRFARLSNGEGEADAIRFETDGLALYAAVGFP